MPTETNCFTQSYTDLPDHFYSEIEVEPLFDAELVHHNRLLAQQIGIDLSDSEILKMTAGSILPESLKPVAQKYTGHQFGYYNPDLGDGRGVLLGQVKDKNDNYWDLHLKGSGQTPYSRRGDGRAVLRSAVREYLIGEALHALNIPTTRCLSLCKNQEQVIREQLEPRASYIRVAKTHIRFGHFEWLAQRGNLEEQKQLAEYVIRTVYPELADIDPEQTRYAKLLEIICQKTAEMIAGWQSVGFCHGVMNTDNMSVAGETFDFGPYSFLDDCSIHYICNHSDTEGRYAYSQQPNIGLWNCQVLAGAFSNLVSSEEIDQAINHYIETFNSTYLLKMGYKFGLVAPVEDDKHFIADTLILLNQSALDFHYFFNLLAHFDTDSHQTLLGFVGGSKAWNLWFETYRNRLALQEQNQRNQLLEKHNPKLILRNYIAQELIEAAENGDYQQLDDWINWLQKPFTSAINTNKPADLPPNRYFLPPEKEQKSLILSCSS